MKLLQSPPFEEYSAYLNFHSKMGRWQVCLVSSKSRRTILYSKYIMSVHLGRMLLPHEEVDHIDGDKTNDSLSNLEIVSRSENIRRNAARRTKSLVTLICPVCLTSFTREKRKTHLSKGGKTTYCSRSCVGKAVKTRIKIKLESS